MSATTSVPPATAPGGAPTEKPPKKSTRRTKLLDIADWNRHPPVWTTINIAMAILASSWIGYRLDVAWWIPALAGVLGATGLIAAGMSDDLPGARLGWRGACWGIAAAWAAFAVEVDPWHPATLITGIVLTIVFAVFARAIVSRRQALGEAKQASAKASPVTASAEDVWDGENTDVDLLGRNWKARILRVSHIKGVEIPQVALWETPKGCTGFTAEGQLPRGGAGWKTLARDADRLADDAELPHGCGVVFRPGKKRRWFLMDVSMENRLEDEHPMPDPKPRTINNPLDTGVVPDGNEVGHSSRFHNAIVVGQVDSGKTNLLHVINRRVGECVDALLWHIDIGGGGGLSRKWCQAHFEGRAERPVVDWPATTAEEADIMLTGAIKAIETRKAMYQAKMDEADDDKVPVSPELPEIVIVVDEYADLPIKIKNKILTVSNTGRGAGVRLVVCGLRATADVIEPALKKQAHVRYGMRVTDEEELNYLYGWKENIDPELAPYAGCGFVWKQENGKKFLSPFRAYRMKPSRIDADAIKLAPLRPSLDEATAMMIDKVTGNSYSTRIDRTYSKLFINHPAVVETIMSGAPAGTPIFPKNTEETTAMPHDTTSEDDEKARRTAEINRIFDEANNAPGGPAEALERLTELGEQIKATNGIEDTTKSDRPSADEILGADWEEDFKALASGLEPVSREKSALLGIIENAEAAGIGPTEIQKALKEQYGIDKTLKTVHRWLNEEIEAGTVVKGDRGVYLTAGWANRKG